MIQHDLSSILTKTGFCASFIVNGFFIYLTLFHIKNVTGTYKQLVIFFAITGVVFCLIDIFAKPFAHNYNNSMTYFSLNAAVPEWVAQLMLALWAGFYSLIVAAVAVQFIFRYLCLLGAEVTKYSNCFQNFLWVSYPILPATVYGVLLYVLSMADDYSDAYVTDSIFNEYYLVSRKLPRFIMVTYRKDGSPRWKNLSYLGSAGAIVFVHYTIIIICGVLMHFKMKSGMQQFSVANQKLQRQFFKALIFQSLGPTFFIFLPAIPVLLGPLVPLKAGTEISWQTGWLFSVIGAYPPFDSISFMLIVVEYKNVIKNRYFKGSFNNLINSINTVSVNSRNTAPTNRMYSTN